MSDFRFSKRSLNNLKGVRQPLVRVAHRAIAITEIDFGVIDGLRTREEQAALVEAGASQTMNSNHLTGEAIDIMAYVGARGSWELPLYHKIADAFAKAAFHEGVGIRWGGAWHIDDVRDWQGSMEAAQDDYIRLRRSQGRRPFLDSGHFELAVV